MAESASPDRTRPDGRDRTTGPVLSVVLPVLNESRDIGRLLEEIRSQDLPADRFEVIVVDGGSVDGTRGIVEKAIESWPNLKLLPNPGRRSAPARNIGARSALGKYVLYLDGHCSLPRKDYLSRLLELFVDSGADCLCRPQPLLGLHDGTWDKCIATARHSLLGHNPGSDIYRKEPGFTDPRSAGAAYLRDVLDRLGGYDERFDACEDVEFNHRVLSSGYSAYLHPDLTVYYRPRSTLSGLFRQMMRYGSGRAHLMSRHPSSAPWPLIALTIGAIGLVVAPLVWGGTGLLLSLSLVGLWLLLLVGEGLRLGGIGGNGVRIAAALAATHLGLLAGFWRGLGAFARFRSPMIAVPSDPLRHGRPHVS